VQNALSPVPVIFQQALALHQTGQLASARNLYEEILKIQSNHFDALHLLGVIAIQTRDFYRAVELIGKAIDVDPQNATAYFNRGIAFKQLAKLEAALASYDGAIAIKSDYSEAYFNRGNVLRVLERFEQALVSYDQAIALQPDRVEAHLNRSNVLAELRQFDAALIGYDRTIMLKPDYAEAHLSRGNLLRYLERFEEATASYDRAIAIKPDYAEAHAFRSHTLLLCGNFENGWRELEWRWKAESAPSKNRNFAEPLWIGEEPILQKTILLHGEQGFGDTLQFCRYAKRVSELGARVILEVPEPLVSLLANLEGVSQLIARGTVLPHFDYQCPLMSLPLAFKTDLATIPGAAKYLRGDSAKAAQWRATLGEKTKPRIGLVWSGSEGHKNDRNRSISLAELIEYLPADLHYVGLQKNVRESDKCALQAMPHMLNFSDELSDFSDTAALCECMDLLISVDTSVAHLGGSLGVNTWVLLPLIPDWRWLLARDDSPWYPTAKLYRQRKAGDWAEVLQRVKAALLETFQCRESPWAE
jgi:tetratricopeptide (TPR) repeat protein